MAKHLPGVNEVVVTYRITGMDCAACARKIEKVVRSFHGVQHAHVSTATQLMTVFPSSLNFNEIERAVSAIGYRLDKLPGSEEDVNHSLSSSDLTHRNPAYRRALLTVVALNLGYGVAQMIGGFLARSQAVKADALDFIGDGAITMLNVVAIGWALAWRARVALVQGLFLGFLGVAVLAGAAFRIANEAPPNVEAMGLLGLLALLVNLAAAAALLPHRAGDSNVRAVWLFSRNDALGNLAVIVAAGLVHVSGTRWPDLVVATIIAGLFLHSAWSIIADAQRDLRSPAIGSAEPGL